MGDIKGFMTISRADFKKEDPGKRIGHWNEFVSIEDDSFLKDQGARCMDCGTPFCQSGCPIDNIIPDWNDLVYRGRWEEALERLLRTNNFPEFTGRVCPAPCENSCVLAINEPAVTIKNIEVAVIEKAFEKNWIKPEPPEERTGKTVAVVGSGPAGLACADQLNKEGHTVTVYEKNEIPGGLLTFGIPDFKLEKRFVKRRIELIEAEGITFKTGVDVGSDVTLEQLRLENDAVVLACGAEQPRDLPVEGRDLDGVHFAMDYLTRQNRINLELPQQNGSHLDAKGKNVIVLGGGDTGSDCIGTANRQGAASIMNFELMPKPPADRTPDNPWPQWALIERSSTSHEEGCERDFSILTKKLSGSGGELEKLHAVRIVFEKDPDTGRNVMKEVPGSEFTVDVDMLILAMGFTGPRKNGMLEESGLALDERGNVKTDENRMTSLEGVFAAGDMRRGQSLVVWAINEGREAAKCVHEHILAKEE